MAVVYLIRDWDEHFECAQSRKVTGPLTWFPMPTKHDGKGYRRIMARKDAPVIYAAWVLMLAVAAKCPVRGRLADSDGPLTAADLELKTGCSSIAFESAFEVLTSKEIGWLVVAQWESDGSVVALQNKTEQDITRQDTSCCAASAELGPDGQPSTAKPPAPREPLSEFVFPTTGKGSADWTLTQAKLDEYVEAYPELDVPAVMRKARQWCRDKARNRKTPGGMLSFLTSWLNREQNRGPIGRVAEPQKQKLSDLVRRP